jgi:HSF-type DNA-binding
MCLVHHTMKVAKNEEKIVPTSSSRTTKIRIPHDRIKVQHNYHDHSHDPTPCPDTTALSAQSKSGSPFPNKLFDMLMRAEEDAISHIISFAPHGRAIQIHDSKALVSLLPKYFTLSKIASFQRQLNLYGFGRLTKGPDRGCYYHEYFLRGRCHEHLLDRMQRTKVKGTFVRARSNPDREPDFWSMPWVGIDDDKPVPIAPVRSMTSLVRSEVPARSVVSLSSTSSVVSHDDEDDNDNESVGITMQASNAMIISAGRHDADDSECMDDIILTTWGQRFHYLPPDSLNDLQVQPRLVDLDDEKTLAKALEALLNEDDENAMYRTCSDFSGGFKL